MSAQDGIQNSGGLAFIGFGPIFLAAVPLTSFIAQSGGVVEKVVDGLAGTVSFVGTAGSSTAVSSSRIVPALGALYVAATYAFSGAASVAGQAAANPRGLDNNHPRSRTSALTGLPLRLYSAHYNMMEQFPGWALAAAMTVALAPNNRELINLLGLHVISKVLIFYPSYIANFAPTRSLAHLLATSATINVCWRLASGAK